MSTASIDRVGSRVVWLIGARSDAFAFEVEDDRFSKQEIAQAIVEAEAELVQDFADSYHPSRSDLLSWVEVAHQAVIPSHLGQIEGVKIAGDDDVYITGQDTTAGNIKLWRDNKDDIFDTLPHTDPDSGLFGYYSLENQVLEFTGSNAKVGIVQYVPDYPVSDTEVGSLQIDSQWEPCLVAGAISKLVKLGVDSDVIQTYTGAWVGYRQRILQGAMMAPEITTVQKTA
jgi:hypothetical protein